MENLQNEKFSVTKRAQSFGHAFRGIKLFFKTTHNAWIHTCVFVLVIILAYFLQISLVEWSLIILASGLVFVAEAFNSAIEVDINLTSPEYHPYARNTKDIAAGAVLISAIIAIVVGLIVFVPHICPLFS